MRFNLEPGELLSESVPCHSELQLKTCKPHSKPQSELPMVLLLPEPRVAGIEAEFLLLEAYLGDMTALRRNALRKIHEFFFSPFKDNFFTCENDASVQALLEAGC